MTQDLRGGCSDMTLDLTGAWTGYNTGPTMQVGLWINNDGEFIGAARVLAAQGTKGLQSWLMHVMSSADPDSAPGMTLTAVLEHQNGWMRIDWAQVCFSLLDRDPEEDDLKAAREYLEGLMGADYEPSEGELWRVAAQRIEDAATTVAMAGIDG